MTKFGFTVNGNDTDGYNCSIDFDGYSRKFDCKDEKTLESKFIVNVFDIIKEMEKDEKNSCDGNCLDCKKYSTCEDKCDICGMAEWCPSSKSPVDCLLFTKEKIDSILMFKLLDRYVSRINSLDASK